MIPRISGAASVIRTLAEDIVSRSVEGKIKVDVLTKSRPLKR